MTMFGKQFMIGGHRCKVVGAKTFYGTRFYRINGRFYSLNALMRYPAC